MDNAGEPTVTFYQLIDGARPPQRADRAAGGVLPTRAFRYCEAVTTASSLGWYVFSPVEFSLYWDGVDVQWSYEGSSGHWFDLGTVQFPHLSDQFDLKAPPSLKGLSPPFLAVLPEPGVVQVWSGLLARTRPDWSLLVRSPVHVPRRGGYEMYEGVVEADSWFGPLFTNIRLTKTNAVITISEELPFFQVQPLPRQAYSSKNLNDFRVANGFRDLTTAEWAAYHSVVSKETEGAQCPVGRNAVEVRRRRQNEHDASILRG